MKFGARNILSLQDTAPNLPGLYSSFPFFSRSLFRITHHVNSEHHFSPFLHFGPRSAETKLSNFDEKETGNKLPKC